MNQQWDEIVRQAKNFGFKDLSTKSIFALQKKVGKGYAYNIYLEQSEIDGRMRDIVTFELTHSGDRRREDTYRFSGWLYDMNTFFLTDDGATMLSRIWQLARKERQPSVRYRYGA